MKQASRHPARAMGLAAILALLPCAALSAQEAEATEPDGYASPWSLGLALGLGAHTPFAQLGSIVPSLQARITNEFRLGGEELRDTALTLDLGFDSIQGIFAEMGVEWERKDGRDLGNPFGLYAGAGFGVEGPALRAGCRWKPLEGRRRSASGETLLASVLSPGLGASYAFVDEEAASNLASGAGFSLDLVAGSFGMNPAKGEERVATARERAVEELPPPLAFLVETSLHSLPLMYLAVIPFPFTEWSFGLEFGGKESSSSILVRVIPPMFYFDFSDCLSLEYCFLRFKLGNWRPGLSLGLMLSNLILYLPSSLDMPWASTVFLGLDLLAFDFVPERGPPIRLSFVPLYSHYLDRTRPHPLALMRLAWMF